METNSMRNRIRPPRSHTSSHNSSHWRQCDQRGICSANTQSSTQDAVLRTYHRPCVQLASVQQSSFVAAHRLQQRVVSRPTATFRIPDAGLVQCSKHSWKSLCPMCRPSCLRRLVLARVWVGACRDNAEGICNTQKTTASPRHRIANQC